MNQTLTKIYYHVCRVEGEASILMMFGDRADARPGLDKSFVYTGLVPQP